jgi:hypothetical protein
MTQFLTKEQVEQIIKAKNTKIATVSFIKSDGTLRTINCLFRPSSKIVGSERGMAQSQEMKDRGQIPIYDLAAKHWKSFYHDKVVEIK